MKPVADELLEHLQKHREKSLLPPPEPEWEDDGGAGSPAPPEGQDAPPTPSEP